jgi:dCMP deaminase
MNINSEQFFMGVAVLSSHRSKDKTKVGACVVSEDNRIIGVGWNGMPKTINDMNNDEVFSWGKDSEDPLDNKYMYIIHAEPNAIHHSSESVKNCTMYLNWFPCADCAKSIVQSGIKKLVYLKHAPTDRYRVSMEGAKRILLNGGVNIVKYNSEKDDIVINFC